MANAGKREAAEWRMVEEKKAFAVYMTPLSGGRTTEITHVFPTTASRNTAVPVALLIKWSQLDHPRALSSVAGEKKEEEGGGKEKKHSTVWILGCRRIHLE